MLNRTLIGLICCLLVNDIAHALDDRGIRQPLVEQHGAMRSVLHDGATEARVSLADVAARPAVVAVGALAGLHGEVTMLDGAVWVARAEGEDLLMSGPEPQPGDQATMLTIASVPAWLTVPLGGDELMAGAELEAAIASAAGAYGLDPRKPFPFVIDGIVDELHLHVITGACPHAPTDAGKRARPWHWRADRPVPALVIGFYAADQAGVMTHQGSNMHVHALLELEGRMITGHIDHLAVAPGAMIRLPVDR